MFALTILLVAAAGACYCAAGALRWRAIAKPEAGSGAASALMWTGVALNSAALAVGLRDGSRPDVMNGVLGLWAAAASLFFLARFLAAPSRWLLALPVGAMAIMLAVASATGRTPEKSERGGSALMVAHEIFMAGYIAAIVVAGAAGGLYLIASRRLKHADPSALRFPMLPRLEAISWRALVVATALLLGGLATGGTLLRMHTVPLAHPTVVLALLGMAVLVLALALRVAGRLGRRGVAGVALASLGIAACALLSLVLGKHG